MKLRVFDFDDTLVTTNCSVKVIHKDGTEVTLAPSEFATYVERDGDEFDFSDFDKVIDPSRTRMMYVFKRRVDANNGKGVVVLTARALKAKRAIRAYLKTVVGDKAMRHLKVITLGSSDPYDKAIWIRNKVLEEGYTDIYFADDSWRNCRAVGNLLDNIKSVTKLEIQKI